jgi:hypothetical protein
VRAAINLFNLKAEKIMKELDKQNCHYRNVLHLKAEKFMKELDKQNCHYRNVLQFERQVKAITQSQLVT